MILVTDVGGVLLVDGMKVFLRRLSEEIGLDQAAIDADFRSSGLRTALWTGEISTGEFWRRLGARISHPLGDPDRLDAEIVRLCAPLPSVPVVAAALDRVWLATNHRSEWVVPALEHAGLRVAPSRILCSSNLGSCKPDRAFFDVVVSRVRQKNASEVTYCDDQAANLTIPQELGWRTVLVGADPAQSLSGVLSG